MTALVHPSMTTAAAPVLQQIHLIPDGNSHRPDLCPDPIGFHKPNLVSEAMLPHIRTVAMLIAASRRNPDQRSPDVFTEEADWFAARIIVLHARFFHLDITLKPMLATANQRAQAFARQHNLSFSPAQMRMSLHAGRPANLLIIETELQLVPVNSLLENSLMLAAQCVFQHCIQLNSVCSGSL